MNTQLSMSLRLLRHALNNHERLQTFIRCFKLYAFHRHFPFQVYSEDLAIGLSRQYSSFSKHIKAPWKRPITNPIGPILAESSESEEEEEEEEEKEQEKYEEEEDFWDEEEEMEPKLGDGGDGGGVVLNDVPWGAKALVIAEEVLLMHDRGIRIYAFRVTRSGYVYVRLDKLSDQYGCPEFDEIQLFNSAYANSLEAAGIKGDVPKNLAVEVSSPGIERLLRVPEDLERFKDLPMYVSYLEEKTDSILGRRLLNGILMLDSIDLEARECTWKVANVAVNRGNGRPTLSRKQRLLTLLLPFESHEVVKLYLKS